MSHEMLVPDPPVQHAAQADGVCDRVDRLRDLTDRAMSHYLVLGQALYVEHEAALWQRARTATGEHYDSEEAFWEGALGIKRRTAYQLIAIGRIMTSLQLREADRGALGALGLVKLSAVIPVLERQTTVSGLRRWISIAETHSRDSLRARVRKALGRSPRPQHTQAERVQAYLLDAMPDLESRALADRFFTVGARYVGSDNAIATLIAAFQEALGTWEAHVTDARDDDDHAGGDDRD